MTRLSVDNGVETGFDPSFEDRWWRFMKGTRTAFALLMIVGVSGLFGRGPLSKTSAYTDHGLQVEYERMIRFKTPSQVKVRFPAQANRPITLAISGTCYEKGRISRQVPEPEASHPIRE